MVKDNADAVKVTVTIFSILAGFLVAIITVVTGSAIRKADDWESLRSIKREIKRRLIRLKILFILYMATLASALLVLLIPGDFIQLLNLLQGLFLGLVAFSFLISFALPGSLINLQLEHYEAEILEKEPVALKSAREKARNLKK